MPIYILALSFQKVSRKENKKMILLSMLFLATIYLTFSRGAWLGLILGIVFITIYSLSLKIKMKSRFVIPSLFLIGFLASFFFIIKGSYSFGLVPNSRVEQSDNIRKEIWTTSLDIGLQHKWLGVGLGNFQNYFSEYTKTRINYPEYITPNAVTPHNIFLNIWLQTGLLGLLGLLCILAIFFLRCLQGVKKEAVINLVLMSSMIAIIGQGLVDSSIWKNDLILMFWFLVCSAYIINRKGEKNGE